MQVKLARDGTAAAAHAVQRRRYRDGDVTTVPIVHDEVIGPDATNPRCPDYVVHVQNAVERFFPERVAGRRRVHLSPAETDCVDAEADAEYRVCRGH